MNIMYIILSAVKNRLRAKWENCARPLYNNGFTLVEVVVVVAIVGILTGLVISQFAGTNKKFLHESDVKKLYTDLMEMRLKSLSENKIYGIFWDNPSSQTDYAFKTYELRSDKDTSMTRDIDDTDDTVIQTVKIDRGDQGFKEIVVANALRSVAFNSKGIAAIDDELLFYVECKECDKVTTTCKADDPDNLDCKPADRPSDGMCGSAQAFNYCNNPEYPEFSCISVNKTTIKMGKWCDKNCDEIFDSDECQLR